MRLCIERILPPCHERAVKFILPPIVSTTGYCAQRGNCRRVIADTPVP
jgi:hypothetical protein